MSQCVHSRAGVETLKLMGWRGWLSQETSFGHQKKGNTCWSVCEVLQKQTKWKGRISDCPYCLKMTGDRALHNSVYVTNGGFMDTEWQRRKKDRQKPEVSSKKVSYRETTRGPTVCFARNESNSKYLSDFLASALRAHEQLFILRTCSMYGWGDLKK